MAVASPDRKLGLMAGSILLIIAIAVLLGGCTMPGSQGTDNPGTLVPVPTQAATPTPVATLKPSATPTLAPTPTSSPTPAPTPKPEEIDRMYQWSFNGRPYASGLGILKSEYDQYRNRPHDRSYNYAGYTIAVDDRIYFIDLIGTLMDAAQDSGLSDNNSAKSVVTFLQSLPNAPASATSPNDDNAKLPLETLVDGGGDSEDMSILAANLLNNIGYTTVLLGFPGHTAVGVKSSDENVAGRYYTYNGDKYYYLETTAPYMGLGDIPEEYRNMQATIYTMQGTAGIELNMTYGPESSDELYVYYKVHCNVGNSGAVTAQNVSVYFAALALSYGQDKVWVDSEANVGDIPSGEGRTVEATLKIPRSGPTQIECIVSGDNFDMVTAKGERFTL